MLGLALVALFAIAAVAATAALATPEHVYRVEGTKLAANETKEITSHIKSGSEFVLKGERTVIFVTVKSTTRCKKLKLNAAEHPVIVGGQPGTSEKEKIEFEECTGEIETTKCSSVVVENVTTANELVEITAPAALAGKLGTLFKPAKGTVFTKVTFKGCGGFGEQTAEVEGTAAALVSPEKTEAVAGSLVYGASATEEITKVKKQNGTEESVGLKANKKKATIEGTAEVELVSKQKWGAF